MTQIIPPGFAACVVHIASPNYTDGEALMTFGLDIAAVGGTADAAVAVAVALDTSNFDGFLANESSIPLVEVKTDTEQGAATTAITGGNAGAMPPPNVCTLVKKRTQAVGRRAQGRLFVPGILGETELDERGMINPPTLEAMQEVFDDFLTALTTEDVGMVILQNEEGVTPPIAVPPKVTRLLVDPMVSTQRRRLRR